MAGTELDDVTVWDIRFIDLNEDRFGSFSDIDNVDEFVETDLGKAQVAVIKQDLRDMGVEEELSDAQIRGFLFSAQSLQSGGEYNDLLKIIPDREALDEYGTTDKVMDKLSSLFNNAVEGIKGYVEKPEVEVNDEGLLKSVSERSDNMERMMRDSDEFAMPSPM